MVYYKLLHLAEAANDAELQYDEFDSTVPAGKTVGPSQIVSRNDGDDSFDEKWSDLGFVEQASYTGDNTFVITTDILSKSKSSKDLQNPKTKAKSTNKASNKEANKAKAPKSIKSKSKKTKEESKVTKATSPTKRRLKAKVEEVAEFSSVVNQVPEVILGNNLTIPSYLDKSANEGSNQSSNNHGVGSNNKLETGFFSLFGLDSNQAVEQAPKVKRKTVTRRKVKITKATLANLDFADDISSSTISDQHVNPFASYENFTDKNDHDPFISANQQSQQFINQLDINQQVVSQQVVNQKTLDSEIDTKVTKLTNKTSNKEEVEVTNFSSKVSNEVSNKIVNNFFDGFVNSLDDIASKEKTISPKTSSNLVKESEQQLQFQSQTHLPSQLQTQEVFNGLNIESNSILSGSEHNTNKSFDESKKEQIEQLYDNISKQVALLSQLGLVNSDKLQSALSSISQLLQENINQNLVQSSNEIAHESSIKISQDQPFDVDVNSALDSVESTPVSKRKTTTRAKKSVSTKVSKSASTKNTITTLKVVSEQEESKTTSKRVAKKAQETTVAKSAKTKVTITAKATDASESKVAIKTIKASESKATKTSVSKESKTKVTLDLEEPKTTNKRASVKGVSQKTKSVKASTIKTTKASTAKSTKIKEALDLENEAPKATRKRATKTSTTSVKAKTVTTKDKKAKNIASKSTTAKAVTKLGKAVIKSTNKSTKSNSLVSKSTKVESELYCVADEINLLDYTQTNSAKSLANILDAHNANNKPIVSIEAARGSNKESQSVFFAPNKDRIARISDESLAIAGSEKTNWQKRSTLGCGDHRWDKDDEYYVSQCNYDVYDYMMSLADKIIAREKFPGQVVIIQGKHGVGKTHLINAFINRLLVNNQHPNSLRLFNSIQSVYRSAMMNGKIDELVSSILERQINIIDDFQKQNKANSFIVDLFERIKLQDNKLLILVTSTPVDSLFAQPEQVWYQSRLKQTPTLMITLPDYNLRKQVIKVESQKSNVEFTKMQLETLLSVTERSDLRACIGFVKSYAVPNQSFTSLLQSRFNVFIAERLNQNVAMKLVSNETGFSIARLLMANRKKEVYLARVLAIYVLFNYCGLRHLEIARVFKQRHSTIQNALKNADLLLSANDEEFVSRLNNVINGAKQFLVQSSDFA